jgi:DNA-binding IscR family transcriptional regulator
VSLADDCILGNGALHLQFCLATEILAALVAHAPHPVSTPVLEKLTGHPSMDLARICSSLWQSMLITPNSSGEGWILINPAHRITLEDVFRSVVESQQPRANAKSHTAGRPPRMRPDVELFVGQATIAINQSVFRHLRQFSLDRLRGPSVNLTPPSFHFMNATRYDADTELALTSPLS